MMMMNHEDVFCSIIVTNGVSETVLTKKKGQQQGTHRSTDIILENLLHEFENTLTRELKLIVI